MKLTLGHLGYAAPHEYNGIGPFHTVFDSAVNLRATNSLKGIDCIAIWGGEDISPSLYDEKPYHNSGPAEPSARDYAEWELIREAHRAGVPMIGVCRGAQMMCAYAGGKLIQHCNNHQGRHMIDTFDNKRQFSVTSAHHQMMYPYDVPHELLAWSTASLSRGYYPDNTQHAIQLEKRMVKEPELVYFPDIEALAVQCHPEWHSPTDPFNIWFNQLIFKRFFQ